MLGHSELADLSPLRGAPLVQFTAPNTHISDLNPLRGAPLEHVELGATRIFDLEPLRGDAPGSDGPGPSRRSNGSSHAEWSAASSAPSTRA